MDRRAVSRIYVNGTELKYKRVKSRSPIQLFWKRVPVDNLSKSGIGFISEETLEVGEKIAMKVIFPDGHHLNLKGHVRWLDKNNPGYFRIGLQFQAFGRGVHYNPLKTLEYLRKLIPLAPIQINAAMES